MPFSLSRRIVVWRKAKRWKFSDKSRNYVFDDDWSHRGTNYHLQCSDWENTTPFQKNLIAPGCMVLENECFLHSIWLKVRTNHRNCYRRAMIVLGESRLDPPLLGKHMKFQMFKCFGRAWLARSLKDVEYEASIMSKRSRQPSRFRENQEATSESSTQDKRLLLWILLPSQKGLVILCLGLKFYWLMIYRVHFTLVFLVDSCQLIIDPFPLFLQVLQRCLKLGDLYWFFPFIFYFYLHIFDFIFLLYFLYFFHHWLFF